MKKKNTNQGKLLTRGRIIALFSAFFLVVSAFLPWGYSSKVLVTGIVGDGWVIVGLGVLAFFFLYIRRAPILLSALIGIIGLIVGLMDIRAMNEIVGIISGQIGLGLYITVISSIGIVFGTIIEMYEDRKNRYFANT